ncbi:C45 family autoproteolytic acyltransferase/hydolase [Ornithinimicrobium sp. INDO-MA30-4]|uniref:C45 family autoproteolytic acyltransferase/hydolase n=1 Tax=Ornithinimicrobium sp. INDO-MA30-4 TaxID=2908651 RepID=UPI001F36D084|nr:C45 family peptidase [Ornithinimicrobium sp. INDO-MA30-4]UJH70102.1 C45 family autoproteolytic acyltransferase/hydrolase [Ornithinimicrobium sp. INDO-MA30-4]
MQTLTNKPQLPTVPSDWQAWIEYGLAWAEVTANRTLAQEVVSPAKWETPASARQQHLSMTGYRESQPGARWKALYDATWPAYRAWWASDGLDARPELAEAKAALSKHMPELLPTWKRLVRLTDGDSVAAAFLTMWRAPIFAAGCTQVIVDGPDPVLIRNYDYDPALFESVVASTNYSGGRKVIGTSDLLWGLLDGTNEDGLAVSLTYGGRPARADDAPGFAIPLVLRYLLETCADVPAAIEALRRLPIAQAYTLALVDTAGGAASVYVAPGEEPLVSDLRATTNHRLEEVEFPEIAIPLDSVTRQQVAQSTLKQACSGAWVDVDVLSEAFTSAPLRQEGYGVGFGTMYTAVYRPARGEVTYLWPDAVWRRTFDDGEDKVDVWVSQK